MTKLSRSNVSFTKQKETGMPQLQTLLFSTITQTWGMRRVSCLPILMDTIFSYPFVKEKKREPAGRNVDQTHSGSEAADTTSLTLQPPPRNVTIPTFLRFGLPVRSRFYPRALASLL